MVQSPTHNFAISPKLKGEDPENVSRRKSESLFIVVDFDGGIICSSPDFNRRWLNEAKLKTQKLMDLVAPRKRASIEKLMIVMRDNPGELGPFPFRLKHPQGYWLSSTLTFEREECATEIRVVVRDISPRKGRVQERCNAAHHYRKLLDQSDTGLCCLKLARPLPTGWDANRRVAHLMKHAQVTFCNDAFRSLFLPGLKDDEKPVSLESLLSHDLENIHWLEKLTEPGEEWASDALTIKRLNQPETQIRTRIHKEYRDGMLWKLWCTFQPIAVSKAESHLRVLIDNLEQAIFLKDSDLRYVTANKTYCSNIGLTEADIVGRTDFDIHPAHLADKYRADDREVIHHGERLEFEQQVVFKNGNSRIVRVFKTPVRDDKGKMGVLGIYWDITDEKNLQEQRRYAQKVDALSKLAGHVANDFNNILTAILGNIDLLKSRLPNQPSILDSVDSIEHATQRATQLTSRIMSLSRPPMVDMQPLDLNSMVEQWIRGQTFPANIKLNFHPVISGWMVQADIRQFNLILKNVIVNAIESMPDGGNLTISVENISLTDQQSGAFSYRPGDYIRLTVEDTGTGIRSEFQERIFDPFFSTKKESARGLGLALVRQAVEQHHGWIKCESKEGEGTRLRVWFPRFVRDSRDQIHSAMEKTRSSKKLVLLVEDEDILRNLSQQFLVKLGYEVLGAENGQKALEIYQSRWQDIGVVLLDLSLPGMSGLETLDHLQSKNPQVQVLLTSGFSSPTLPPNLQHNVRGFLAKPFRLDQLAKLMREVLQH